MAGFRRVGLWRIRLLGGKLVGVGLVVRVSRLFEVRYGLRSWLSGVIWVLLRLLGSYLMGVDLALTLRLLGIGHSPGACRLRTAKSRIGLLKAKPSTIISVRRVRSLVVWHRSGA